MHTQSQWCARHVQCIVCLWDIEGHMWPTGLYRCDIHYTEEFYLLTVSSWPLFLSLWCYVADFKAKRIKIIKKDLEFCCLDSFCFDSYKSTVVHSYKIRLMKISNSAFVFNMFLRWCLKIIGVIFVDSFQYCLCLIFSFGTHLSRDHRSVTSAFAWN